MESFDNCRFILQFLLSHNADITAQTEDGWFPIHSAARWNQDRVLSVLLEQGADINSRTNSGQTPLHLAASEKENGEAIALLLSNCYLDTTIRNSVGETAEEICSRTSEHCKLFEERRKQQPRLMGNTDPPEGTLGNMDHSSGSGVDHKDANFDCRNLTDAKDHSGDILNLSDNVAQGFEDLSVSMDTNDNEKTSDQHETCHYPHHHAMDENP
jgi:ankyrin repeat protein